MYLNFDLELALNISYFLWNMFQPRGGKLSTLVGKPRPPSLAIGHLNIHDLIIEIIVIIIIGRMGFPKGAAE